MKDSYVHKMDAVAEALIDGRHADDPLAADDVAQVRRAVEELMPVAHVCGGVSHEVARVMLAAYSLGARHALERVDALGRANCADVPDEETICLGDEPRPPQRGEEASRGH